MSHDRLRSTFAMLAQMAARGFAPPKLGKVTSYDPKTYAVKVMLQPEEIETGWLPIKVLMGGSAFGAYFGPANGDQALVIFHEGDATSGLCLGFLPSEEDQPPEVKSGEFHLIVKADAAHVIMKPDGTIASKGTWTHTGSMKVTGAAEFDSTMDVKGAATLESTLGVSGKTTAAAIDSSGPIRVGGVTVTVP